MSNINWNQFFNNNFPNNFNGINQSGELELHNTESPGLNLYNPPQVHHKSTPLDVLLPRYINQLKNTSTELAELNQKQTTQMVKELLNLPKDFEQLMTQLTAPEIPKNIQHTALLLLASSMNLEQLSNLLQNSSKQAMTKLYQMLAQYNQIGVSIKDEQIGMISKLISFVSASSSSDIQSLQTTMLMYLPWLPLTDPNAFKLEIDKFKDNSAENIDDSVSILIQTENYGNISSVIWKTDKDGIIIEFTTSETFPIEDFVYLMKEECKKFSININFQLDKKAVFNKEKNEKTQTQVSMNISKNVNPFLLLVSNMLIKNVHIIDVKENIREQRKEKLDNGKD